MNINTRDLGLYSDVDQSLAIQRRIPRWRCAPSPSMEFLGFALLADVGAA